MLSKLYILISVLIMQMSLIEIGNWQEKFDERQTYAQDFYTSTLHDAESVLMHKTFDMQYAHNDELHVGVGSLKYKSTCSDWRRARNGDRSARREGWPLAARGTVTLQTLFIYLVSSDSVNSYYFAY